MTLHGCQHLKVVGRLSDNVGSHFAGIEVGCTVHECETALLVY